ERGAGQQGGAVEKQLPPPSYGGGGPQGRRGKAAVWASAGFRSEIFKIAFGAFPLPTLPRKTGEAKKSRVHGSHRSQQAQQALRRRLPCREGRRSHDRRPGIRGAGRPVG